LAEDPKDDTMRESNGILVEGRLAPLVEVHFACEVQGQRLRDRQVGASLVRFVPIRHDDLSEHFRRHREKQGATT
jgi:hypothetical protein